MDHYINRFSNAEQSFPAWNKPLVQYVVFSLCRAEFILPTFTFFGSFFFNYTWHSISACLIIFESRLLLAIFLYSEHIKHLFYILYLTTRISVIFEWPNGFLVLLINSFVAYLKCFLFLFFKFWIHVPRNFACVPIVPKENLASQS